MPLSVAQAQKHIWESLRPLGRECIPLTAALKRRLAAEVRAQVDHPPADIAAMDGYALATADGFAPRLVIAEHTAADQTSGQALAANQCVRIFTGAPIPPGADCVIPEESCLYDPHNQHMTLKDQAQNQRGQFIRRRGQDFSKGQVVIPAGCLLTPRHIALAAAANHAWLTVYRRPQVAILSSGSELALPGEPASPLARRNSNALGLAALLQLMGADAHLLPSLPDDLDACTQAFENLSRAATDLVITSGGASVGRHDLLRQAITASGGTIAFWQVNMRPGKPSFLAHKDGLPILGVPGNPVSALVCTLVLASPAIARLSGADHWRQPTIPATTTTELPQQKQRQTYLRCRLNPTPQGSLAATALGQQDSAALHELAQANGLILRPPYAAAAQPGDAIVVWPFLDLQNLAL